MNQQKNHVNKQFSVERMSSSSMDENIYGSITNNSVSSSFYSYVNDIPFEVNQKYRVTRSSNIDIDQYDTKQMVELLSRNFDFQVENRVLLEALEDVKRKKKEIETDVNHQSLNKAQISNSSSHECQPSTVNIQYENSMKSSPSIPISNPSLVTNIKPPTNPRIFQPAMIHSSNGIQNPSSSNSFRLPSVRDIYWPTANQQQYSIPTSNINCLTPPSNPVIYPINSNLQGNLPSSSSIQSSSSTTTNLCLSLNPTLNSLTTRPLTTISPVKSNNRPTNNSNSFSTDDLTTTFDETLRSDDPFHDAELRSLNDVAELNHLYSSIASANTIRR